MSRPHAQEDAEDPPLWQAVRYSDYERPARPAAEAVRSGLLGLFRGNRDKKRRPLVAEESLRRPSIDLLNAVAAWPDWRDAVPRLDGALADFLSAETGQQRIRAVVGAPYSGTRETVRCWAAQHEWPLVEPPAPQRILAQDETWLESIGSDDGPPVVIAELEHCMLRHPFGLAFLRHMLDRLRLSSRPCVIATNSWTWAYLDRTMRIGDGLGEPVTLQALDGSRLARWFGQLVQYNEPVLFRQADDGSVVLTTADNRDASAEAAQHPTKDSNFLESLAGYSRGIGGVAWGIWRRSLEAAVSGEAAPEHAEPTTAPEPPVIWLRPWSQIPRPTLPDEAGLDHLLVLHALLIHGGLPQDTLCAVLSALGARTGAVLEGLAAQGIVEAQQGRWQVTPVGYPAAREALESEGLMVDDL